MFEEFILLFSHSHEAGAVCTTVKRAMDLTTSGFGLTARLDATISVDCKGSDNTAATPRSSLVKAVKRLGWSVKGQPRGHAATAAGRRLHSQRAIAIVAGSVRKSVDGAGEVADKEIGSKGAWYQTKGRDGDRGDTHGG